MDSPDVYPKPIMTQNVKARQRLKLKQTMYAFFLQPAETVIQSIQLSPAVPLSPPLPFQQASLRFLCHPIRPVHLPCPVLKELGQLHTRLRVEPVFFHPRHPQLQGRFPFPLPLQQ